MSLTKAALSSKCFYLIYFSMLRDEDPQNRDPADAGSTQGSEAGREARAQGSGPSFGHHTLQTPPTLPPPFPTSSPKTFPRLSGTDSAEPTKGRAMSRRTADLREPPTASCLTPPGPAPPPAPQRRAPSPQRRTEPRARPQRAGPGESGLSAREKRGETRPRYLLRGPMLLSPGDHHRPPPVTSAPPAAPQRSARPKGCSQPAAAGFPHPRSMVRPHPPCVQAHPGRAIRGKGVREKEGGGSAAPHVTARSAAARDRLFHPLEGSKA